MHFLVCRHGFQTRKTVTQYHNIIGYSLGPIFEAFALLVTSVGIFGGGITQIVASASSQYSISPQFSMR